MEKAELEKIREELVQARTALKKQLDIISDPDTGDHVPGDFAAKFPNYGDDYYTELEDNSPTEVADYATNLDVTQNLERRFKSIEAALERMDADKFGYCQEQECEAEISPDRLKANPAASLCIECARKQSA